MELVVVDIETTGLSPHRHKITEIAAVKIKDGQIVDEFSTLVDPECPIPQFITRLTGITNDMVRGAPKIDAAIKEFLKFAQGAIFVGHNASFDLRFLSHYAQVHNHCYDCTVICTRKLANRLLPELPSKKLGNICDHFSVVNTQAHRAMADVQATVQILNNMLEMLRQRGLHDLERVAQFSQLPPQKALKLLVE